MLPSQPVATNQPPTTDAGRPRSWPWLDGLVLAGVYLGMAIWTWRKWPDPLVDFGRELYVPWQLAEGGKVLYRDIAHFSGPLSAYFNALLFRLFGPGMMVLAWANMALLASVTAALYALLRQSSDRWAAVAACAFMLLVFAFGQMTLIGNYNFVTPYSHELTHGLILSVLGLWILWRGLRVRSSLRLVAAGALLGLVFLTKPEAFVAGAAAMGTLLLAAPSDVAWSWTRKWGAFAFSAVLPSLIAIALLGAAMPLSSAARGVVGGWNWVFDAQLQSLPFYRVGMGLDAIAANLGRVLGWSACYGGLMGAGVVVASAVGPSRRAVPGFAAFVATAAAVGVFGKVIPWGEALSGLPLALAMAGVVAATRLARTPERQARAVWSLRLSLAVFGLAMLAKMPLHTRPYHYGFALAMPGSLVLATAAVGWLPQWADRRGASANVVRGVGLALLAVTAAAYLGYVSDHLRQRVYPVGAGKDLFFADQRGRLIQQVVGQLKKNVLVDEGLVVLPEGVMLNYLARLPNPTPYLNFMPPELIMFGEETILQSLRHASPRYLLLTHKDTREYGYAFFGRDYATHLGRWIQDNYHPQALYGDAPLRRGSEFGILVMERNGAPASSPP